MANNTLCLNIQSPADQAYYTVDLFNNAEVKLGLSILKFTQFNQPKSFVISDIQIIVNNKSDVVFGKQHLGDYDYSILSGQKYNCILLVDNFPVYGVLEIDEILHKSKPRVVTYKASVTGSRYIWINEISDRLLNTLDLGFFVFTTSLVQRSWDRFGQLGTRGDSSAGDIPILLDPSNNTGNYSDPDDSLPIYRDAPFDNTAWTWRHDRDTHEGGFVFAPIHYGSWTMQLDPFGLDFPDRDAVGPPPFIPSDFAIRVQDLRPSIYVKWVLESIFSQWTDYTLISNFINTEFFEGLILPHTSGDDWLPNLDDYEIIVGTTSLTMPYAPSSTGLWFTHDDEFAYNGYRDPLNLWDGNQYIPDRIVTSKFIWSFDIDDTDPAYTALAADYTDMVVELILDNVTVQTVTVPINGSRFSTEDDGTSNSTPDSPFGFNYITIPANSVVELEYYFIPNDNPALSSGELPIVDMTFRNIVRKNIPSDGIQIDLAPLLHKDLTVKTFLDGLTHMFNLVILTDPVNKTVRIEPDEAAFLRGSRLVDWTSILDCGVDIIQKNNATVSSEDIKGYEIKYKEDSEDGYVEELQSTLGINIYSHVTSAYDNEEAKDKLTTYENPTFAATWYIRDWDVKSERSIPTSTNIPAPPVWPRLWEEFEQDTEGAETLYRSNPLYTGRDAKFSWCPRILYYNGGQWYENDTHLSNIGFRYQSTGVEGSYISRYPFYPETVMVNYSDPQNYSLAFNNDNISNDPLLRINYINDGIDEPTDVGLISNYWVSYLVAAKYGSELKIVVRLTPLQLSQINFLDIIFISHPTLGNGIYRLGEIEEYSPTTEKALVQLIRLPLIDTEPIIE